MCEINNLIIKFFFIYIEVYNKSVDQRIPNFFSDESLTDMKNVCAPLNK